MNDTKILEINKILNKYLSKFNCQCGGADTDFYCYPDDNKIYYAFTYVANDDKYFNALFDRLGLKYNADPFILALFHEIGHCVTWQQFNKFDIICIEFMKNMIDNGHPNKIKKMIYPVLFDEYKATQWACNYINTHPQEIRKLWEVIQPLILQFYQDNGLLFY